jgi:hypothetical protein
MSHDDPVLAILGVVGLLGLALVLLVISIRGLIQIGDGPGEVGVSATGSTAILAGKNGLTLMLIAGSASAIAGIVLLVTTLKG